MSLKTDFLRTIARNPGKFLVTINRGGRSVLDDEFDARSPLSWLPTEVSSEIFSEGIQLPPLRLMDSGNQSIEGLAALVGIARMVRAETVFEIGTYNGVTAYTLALNLPNATVHTLDLPPENQPVLPLEVGDNHHIRARDSRAYENTAVADRVTQHLGDSAKFDFQPFFGKCDLVYVDGAHSYEYVMNDTQAAKRMLHTGGVIVWDDYWKNVPGVPRYLNSIRHQNLYRVPRTRLVMSLNMDHG